MSDLTASLSASTPETDPRPKSSTEEHRFRHNTYVERWLRDILADNATPPPWCRPPTILDIFRYRYHHGPNLGSIFVFEWWLYPHLFPGHYTHSELDAVDAWVAKIGVEDTRKMFEQHWASTVTDAHIEWLRETAKCTTIRLPIGYYHLHSAYLAGTPFARYAHVYENAWSYIVRLAKRIRSAEIGVIIDLHALPGGANSNHHSGTSNIHAELWESKTYRRLSVTCCEFLAREVRGGLDVVGIQIVNEAEYSGSTMFEWYDECIGAISSIDPSIPVIISDAWNLTKAIDYAITKNTVRTSKKTCPIIIDTHMYWCFSDADKAKNPGQIISEANGKLTELNDREHKICGLGAVQTIVGEYSCTFSEETWRKMPRVGVSRVDWEKQFGLAQNCRWRQRSGGALFWTYSPSCAEDRGWNFETMHEIGAIPLLRFKTFDSDTIERCITKAIETSDDRMVEARTEHDEYWNHDWPELWGSSWRYDRGWKTGYTDAMMFFLGDGVEYDGEGLVVRGNIKPGNQIGCVELWILKRLRDCGFEQHLMWMFENGLRRGIRDFYQAVEEGRL